MNAIYQLQAGWLNLFLFALPEPDYMGHWMAQALRSDVLPHVPGC